MAHATTKTIELALPKTTLTPCILDDDPAQLDLMTEQVAILGYEAIPTSNPEEALRLIRTGALPDGICRCAYAGNERIRISGPGAAKRSGSARHRDDGQLHTGFGAGCNPPWRDGFPAKPIDRVRMKRTLDEAAALYDQRRRVKALEEQLLKDLEFHGIVGKSPAMLEVFDFARKVARHYTNVLLTGSTGAGKELVARAIHQISPVSQQKLAVCNCSALVDTLVESQLFGHVRGSFTGATDTRPGLFEYANGGTVFLDEIGETSLSMQAKLLARTPRRRV